MPLSEEGGMGELAINQLIRGGASYVIGWGAYLVFTDWP